jgi:hypothetical protein
MNAQTTRVYCDSGLEGWQGYLRDNYADIEEFEHYSDMFGLAERLGYESAQEAWDDNPLVQGSVNPSDFRKVNQ